MDGPCVEAGCCGCDCGCCCGCGTTGGGVHTADKAASSPCPGAFPCPDLAPVPDPSPPTSPGPDAVGLMTGAFEVITSSALVPCVMCDKQQQQQQQQQPQQKQQPTATTTKNKKQETKIRYLQCIRTRLSASI